MHEAFDEPIKTLNGIPLSVGQGMTIRVALGAFAMSLQSGGLGDDETGKQLSQGYLKCIGEIARIYSVKEDY
jgi:hypothetical protein